MFFRKSATDWNQTFFAFETPSSSHKKQQLQERIKVKLPKASRYNVQFFSFLPLRLKNLETFRFSGFAHNKTFCKLAVVYL